MGIKLPEIEIIDLKKVVIKRKRKGDDFPATESSH